MGNTEAASSQESESTCYSGDYDAQEARLLSIARLQQLEFISNLEDYDAGAAEIVSAARSQIGVPYSWGGGGYKGKSKGIDKGSETIGFDCSGLAQYAVYEGTGKIIARVARDQYNDGHFLTVAYSDRRAGDLVFFGNPINHVGVISGANTMIYAPKPGDYVKEAPIWSSGRQSYVKRCD